MEGDHVSSRAVLAGLVAVASGVSLLVPVAVAGAPKVPPPAAAAVTSPKLPKGYTVVISPTLVAAPGTQTRARVDCPAGTVPLGGGGFSHSTSPAVNLNSSFPTPTGWGVDLNNGTTAASAFDVRVVCGRTPKRYVVIASEPGLVPAHDQDSAFAFCPEGTRILGGGGLSDSGLVGVNLNSTFPETGEWRVDEANTSDLDTHVTAFAICGRLPGLTLVRGPGVVVEPGVQAFLPVFCPGPTLPVSGGVFSFSSGATNTVNTSIPAGTGWRVDMNSISTIGIEADPYVICAGR
jgi:hypothetical protein